MVIVWQRERRLRPKWYVRRVMRRANQLMLDNPGPDRVLLCLRLPPEGTTLDEIPVYCNASPYRVAAEIEPDLRRIYRRIMLLEPLYFDDIPYM